MERASAWASVVFPTPGTSSSRMCPLASSAAMQNCTTSALPRITFSTFACSSATLSSERRMGIGCVVMRHSYDVAGTATLPLVLPAPDASVLRIHHLAREAEAVLGQDARGGIRLRQRVRDDLQRRIRLE